MSPDTNEQPRKDASGFDIIGQAARVETVMDKDVRHAEMTPEREAAIISRFHAWRKNHPNPRDPRKLRSLEDCAKEIARGKIEISGATLSEVLSRKYKGDGPAQLLKIESFLDAEEERAGRIEFPQHVPVDLTWKLWGVFNNAAKYNRMAAVIGESGDGKTAHALAYERENPGAIYMRVRHERSDARDVSDLVCSAIPDLVPLQAQSHRNRSRGIVDWLRCHRSTMFMVDEAQLMAHGGVEEFRTYHDLADPAQQRGLPIVFLGDPNFKRLIVRAKGGVKTAVAPQVARRMIFVFDIDAQGSGQGGGETFTVEDVLRIVHSGRLKLITTEAAHWLAKLANTPSSGHVGQMLDTLRVAIDLAAKLNAAIVDVAHLQKALQMSNGDELAKAIDAAAGGELLRRVVA